MHHLGETQEPTHRPGHWPVVKTSASSLYHHILIAPKSRLAVLFFVPWGHLAAFGRPLERHAPG